VSLERAPEDRYDSALDFAHALEAGLHGHDTDATRRLAAGPTTDPDATRALGQVTDATQALRTRQRPPIAPLPPGERGRQSPAAAPSADAAKRKARNRRWGQFLVLLAILMAIAAVALVLLSSGSSDNGISPVDRNDVQQQIDGIEQFLRDNTQ
jgi:hypothetical protein